MTEGLHKVFTPVESRDTRLMITNRNLPYRSFSTTTMCVSECLEYILYKLCTDINLRTWMHPDRKNGMMLSKLEYSLDLCCHLKAITYEHERKNGIMKFLISIIEPIETRV